MPSPLHTVPWDSCLLAPSRDRKVEAYLKREVGNVPAWSRHFWASPWFSKAMIRLGFHGGLLLRLDFDFANLIALVVSQENSCRYCYAAYRAMLRMLGLNEARMQDLEHRLGTIELDQRTAAAVRFARSVNRGHALDGEAERSLLKDAGFDDEEIRELAYVTVCMGFMNRLCTAAALAPQSWERAPDNPLMRLMGPLVSRMVGRMMKRGTTAPQMPPPSVLAPALGAIYAGSPIGRVLSESLADLWSDQTLSRRSKVLMLATIAYGLDCGYCRREAAALAAAEGLDAETLDAIISHLDDPGLLAEERALIDYARATLWYEPQALQRQSRELKEALGERRFLEALAVAIFANTYIRLAGALLPSS